MEEIVQEKISADHLLYVSLKYTKTCDIINNLLHRWKGVIEMGMDKLLERAKEKGKISEVPDTDMQKIDKVLQAHKNEKEIVDAVEFFRMLRKLDDLRKERSGEFRKNVTLKIFFQGKEIPVNLDKLGEYSDLMEKFISKLKQYFLS